MSTVCFKKGCPSLLHRGTTRISPNKAEKITTLEANFPLPPSPIHTHTFLIMLYFHPAVEDMIFTVTLEKTSAGLGFSLEGGKGSVYGDRPIVINRLFKGK